MVQLTILPVSCLLILSSVVTGARKDRKGSKISRNKQCDDIWDNKACKGQFGNEQCYSCGSRIEYLISTGVSDSVARQTIAEEYFGACGACSPNSAELKLSYGGYREVWRDDFNGQGSVDSSKWRAVNRGDGFGNNELQYYTDRSSNVWLSGGTLKIRAKAESYGGNQYTSAKLESTRNWVYGKFSVRAKFGNARGTWAAIWMMPNRSKYGGWPRSGEIDIMEHVGYDSGVVHGTVHTQAYHHSIGTQLGGTTRVSVDGFHTYTVEWREDLMLFACDGEVYQVFRKRDDTKDKWPFDHKFYLILNMAVGGNWGGVKGIDERAFAGDGQILEVDWAKVEQK